MPTGLSPARLRVPQITVVFWILKALTTAMGESASDYLVGALRPIPAVLLGFAAFSVAMVLQLSRRRYVAWAYWFAVAMVGVFGTMVADVLHVGFGVPYTVSTAACAFGLAAVFVVWHRAEGTLSIHDIDTTRRELFYWCAVIATFALGTAAGDMTSVALGLGYFGSTVLFAAVIAIPAIGYACFRRHPVLAFWSAYVLTRPLGASVADGLGKPRVVGGLGWGDGSVALVLTLAIAAVVAYLVVSRRDVQNLRDQVPTADLPRERLTP